jgi:hypothetical protein
VKRPALTGGDGLDLDKTLARPNGPTGIVNEAVPNDAIGDATIRNCLVPWAVSRDANRKIGEAATLIL